MSKIFIQMLLSLVVVASAVVGLSPELKGKVSKTLREAKTFAQEITPSIFQTANVDAEAEASAQTSIEASLESEVEGDVELETNVGFELDKTLKGISETSTGILLSTESETQVEVKSNDLKLDLENETESELDLEVGVGN